MADNISVEAAASRLRVSSLIAAAICNSRAAAAAEPEAEQRSVVEFTDSLQRLREAFEQTASAGIPLGLILGLTTSVALHVVLFAS